MIYDENKTITQLSDPKTQRQAFSTIVHQYSEPLYWKIRHIIMNHEDTNDVLQNTFIKAWNNLDDFQNKSKFSTWLYRIAINESLDFLRRKKTSSCMESEVDVSVANQLMSDEYFDGEETEALLHDAISQLPDVQRMVFNLRYYDEMKYSDMSKMLNTSEGALKASYHLAVKKIIAFFENKN